MLNNGKLAGRAPTFSLSPHKQGGVEIERVTNETKKEKDGLNYLLQQTSNHGYIMTNQPTL